jgi:drug/metabolite transporter (DMT)-like permease
VRGAAILVVSLRQTRLPIAAAIGFLLFSEVPSVWVWVGTAVIAAAAVIFTRGEARSGSGTGR